MKKTTLFENIRAYAFNQADAVVAEVKQGLSIADAKKKFKAIQTEADSGTKYLVAVGALDKGQRTRELEGVKGILERALADAEALLAPKAEPKAQKGKGKGKARAKDTPNLDELAKVFARNPELAKAFARALGKVSKG